MGIGAMFGTLNTVQAIWLKSQYPIKEENVICALSILTRQIPHLQFCLSKRKCRLWFKRMKNISVDFESSTKDVMEVYEELLETKYNLWTGPLWKVRMIIPNANNTNEENDSFTAAIIFSVQHSITDGTSNMRLCRDLVEILNQISAGKSVVPKPIPLSPTIDNTMEGIPSVSFLAKYFCKKFLATMIKNFYHKTSFDGSLPVPETTETKTKVLYDEITESETEALIKMCKAAKITVHSCIVAATNFALLKLAQSKTDNPLGKCAINVTHCVNMRKYFEPEHNDASGCHISFVEDKSKMSLHESRDFWNQAQKVHSSIKEHLEVSKDQLRIVPLLRLASMIFPANVYLTKKGHKNKTDCHYVTTNMGNLKTMLPAPKEGDDVEITNVLRSVTSHLAGNPFLLTFHTFRNKFMVSIDYYTNKMTDETAQEFFNILLQFIRNLTQYGNLYGPPKY
ncbi:UNVERIFIED_CONTAM: hypothetical protein GTU68_011858 [Idotea baltica]|nr:hypothetical protein [Idotea baltica]